MSLFFLAIIGLIYFVGNKLHHGGASSTSISISTTSTLLSIQSIDSNLEGCEFVNVVLVDIGPDKVQEIIIIREVTAVVLKEAMDLVNMLPSKVVSMVPMDRAKYIQELLEAKGPLLN